MRTVENQATHILPWLAAAEPEPRWYALHTRSNFESRIAAGLLKKGIPAYLPAFEELHQWKDRQKVVSVPVFPGYLFAQFPDQAAWRMEILKIKGLVQVLGVGSSITPVADDEIARLRLMLNSKLPSFSHPFIREGDWVRIKRGVLRGLEGFLVRVRNQSRLVLSISLLCQSVATEVNASDVEPARRLRAA